MSEARPDGRPPRVPDDELIATIREHHQDGEGMAGVGALRPSTIAAHRPIASSTVAKHCRRLVREGRLERATGIDPDSGRPLYGFVPPEVTESNSDRTDPMSPRK